MASELCENNVFLLGFISFGLFGNFLHTEMWSRSFSETVPEAQLGFEGQYSTWYNACWILHHADIPHGWVFSCQTGQD